MYSPQEREPAETQLLEATRIRKVLHMVQLDRNMDELTKNKRIRAGHQGSETKIVTKIKERLTNYNTETDKNDLKQWWST